ncbi:MAG TPA: hypothetical protein DCQ93_05910 [Bacteroidetes bacterium]|nr:hypothetical protein [Bacteroidota bacterium]
MDKEALLRERHNCERMMRQVMLLLDGELSEKQEQDFLTEVKICPHCLESFQMEKAYKEFLFSKVEKKKLPSQTIEDMKMKIRSQLGE